MTTLTNPSLPRARRAFLQAALTTLAATGSVTLLRPGAANADHPPNSMLHSVTNTATNATALNRDMKEGGNVLALEAVTAGGTATALSAFAYPSGQGEPGTEVYGVRAGASGSQSPGTARAVAVEASAAGLEGAEVIGVLGSTFSGVGHRFVG